LRAMHYVRWVCGGGSGPLCGHGTAFRGRPLFGPAAWPWPARALEEAAPCSFTLERLGDRPRPLRVGLLGVPALSFVIGALRALPGLLGRLALLGGRELHAGPSRLGRPMAIACFVDRATVLTLRMCSIAPLRIRRPVWTALSLAPCPFWLARCFLLGHGFASFVQETDWRKNCMGLSVHCDTSICRKGAKMA